jgi:hypothetical protein
MACWTPGAELPARPTTALFDEGRGVQLGFDPPGGGRVSMTHLNLPGVPDYTERHGLLSRPHHRADVPVALSAASADRLTLRRDGGGLALEVQDYRVSYEEASASSCGRSMRPLAARRRC